MAYGNGAASRLSGIRRHAGSMQGRHIFMPATGHDSCRAVRDLSSGPEPARGCAGYAGEEGQRTVMTIASVIASQEWSIPGPHAA